MEPQKRMDARLPRQPLQRTPLMSRSVKQDFTTLIARRQSSERAKGLAFIRATLAERNASAAFRMDATPENLTSWADAKHTLETLKEAL
jgi:hypothetical protein